MSDVNQIDVRRIAALLRAQGRVIRAEMEALGDELCRWRPAENEWCANEVLGHLLEAERRGFNGRIRTILAEDEPRLVGWDQVGVARERRDHEKRSQDLLSEFEALREDSAQLVESLRADHLPRIGHHPDVGALSVQDLIHEWLHHDRNHVKQLLSNVQAYAWPRMGNARRFAEID
jgi:DinB family protein